MQNSLSKKRLLTRRVLPLVLAMVLLLSTAVVAFGSFGAGATGLGTNETLYFNLSKNRLNSCGQRKVYNAINQYL